MSITKGHSTVIEYGDAATYGDSATWTPFAGVTEATPPTPEADDIDVSHMGSEEQFREFTAGWADGGEVELTLQYAKAQAATVYGLFRQDKGFKVTFSDGSHWGVTGYIKSFGDEIDREGIITTAATIKVSGKPVFVEAVS